MLLVALLASGLAACHKAQARTPEPLPPAPPPMTTPNPPERMIIPQSVAAQPPVETAPAQNQGNAPRPIRPPSTTATPPPPNTATPPPTDPPPVVQTNQSSEQLEQQTHRQVASALSHLSGVNYGALSSSGRSTYDEVRRFIRQAEEKLKIRNYVLAEELSRKAVQLASQLVKDHFSLPSSHFSLRGA